MGNSAPKTLDRKRENASIPTPGLQPPQMNCVALVVTYLTTQFLTAHSVNTG